MARIKQDFSLFAGESKDINFTIINDKGAAVDLSTVTEVIWVLARLRSVQENLIVKEKTSVVSANVITIKDNIITVPLIFVDTDQLSGKYRHELRMTIDGGDSVLATGECQIYNSLTKSI